MTLFDPFWHYWHLGVCAVPNSPKSSCLFGTVWRGVREGQKGCFGGPNDPFWTPFGPLFGVILGPLFGTHGPKYGSFIGVIWRVLPKGVPKGGPFLDPFWVLWGS